MKTFEVVVKLITALAAVAGAVYVVAAYGDKIVAWAKSITSRCSCQCAAPAENAPAEETPAAGEAAEEDASAAGEAPAEESPAEDAPVDAPAAEETAPVADESDFVG